MLLLDTDHVVEYQKGTSATARRLEAASGRSDGTRCDDNNHRRRNHAGIACGRSGEAMSRAIGSCHTPSCSNSSTFSRNGT